MKQWVALFVIGLIIIGMPHPVISEMSSSNYEIYADGVLNGGGFSSSGEYNLEDTVGELSSGFSSSSAYDIRAGYQYMERGYLSFEMSSASLDLGILSTSTVNSATTTITVGTDSQTGYTLTITGVSGTSIAAVSDGTVTAGNEEYGFAAIGGASLIAGDTAVATSTIIASYVSPIDGSATDLVFKASKSLSTTVGNYTQTISIAAAANI
jgi:hypothetical protein